MAVVTCLLVLKNLPKAELESDELQEKLKETLRRLFGHYGTVMLITLQRKERAAIVQMETRFQALKAKKSIIDPTHTSISAGDATPIVHDDAEKAILTSIRSEQFSKIKLEWQPTAVIQANFLKSWESAPHGLACKWKFDRVS